MLKLLAIVASLLCLAVSSIAQSPAPAEIDKDLMEVTIPQLQAFETTGTYTITQVVQWHLARIHKYNGIYRPIETILEKEAP